MLHESIRTWKNKDGTTSAIYPGCCMSFFCGESGDACQKCSHFVILSSFKKWIAENNAIVKDSIWSPSVYTSQTLN